MSRGDGSVDEWNTAPSKHYAFLVRTHSILMYLINHMQQNFLLQRIKYIKDTGYIVYKSTRLQGGILVIPATLLLSLLLLLGSTLTVPANASAEPPKPPLPFKIDQYIDLPEAPSDGFGVADIDEDQKFFSKRDAIKTLKDKHGSDIYKNNTILDPDYLGGNPSTGLQTYCPIFGCIFIGKLVESAPIESQTEPFYPGGSPSTVTYTTTTQNTNSREASRGFSAGGSVEVNLSTYGKATAKFDYTQSSEDSTNYMESSTVTTPVTYPANKWSTYEALASGGIYEGYVFWMRPGGSRNSDVHMYPMRGLYKLPGWKSPIVRGLASWDPISKLWDSRIINSPSDELESKHK